MTTKLKYKNKNKVNVSSWQFHLRLGNGFESSV